MHLHASNVDMCTPNGRETREYEYGLKAKRVGINHMVSNFYIWWEEGKGRLPFKKFMDKEE